MHVPIHAFMYTEAQGKHLARLRMQALRQGGQRASGSAHVRGIAAGHTFALHKHPQEAANTEYLTLATHPDISWPVGYLNKKMLGKDNAQVHAALKDKKQKDYTHDNRVDLDDVYHSSASSYLRLMNAYRLDKQAALQSASWGKFQIMGANYEACSVDSIEKFVRAMCSGELGQIQLLSGFIRKNKRLHEAVKKKDWAQIALHYNGPSYKTYQYDSKMQQAYNELKKKGT